MADAQKLFSRPYTVFYECGSRFLIIEFTLELVAMT